MCWFRRRRFQLLLLFFGLFWYHRHKCLFTTTTLDSIEVVFGSTALGVALFIVTWWLRMEISATLFGIFRDHISLNKLIRQLYELGCRGYHDMASINAYLSVQMFTVDLNGLFCLFLFFTCAIRASRYSIFNLLTPKIGMTRFIANWTSRCSKWFFVSALRVTAQCSFVISIELWHIVSFWTFICGNLGDIIFIFIIFFLHFIVLLFIVIILAVLLAEWSEDNI